MEINLFRNLLNSQRLPVDNLGWTDIRELPLVSKICYGVVTLIIISLFCFAAVQ